MALNNKRVSSDLFDTLGDSWKSIAESFGFQQLLGGYAENQVLKELLLLSAWRYSTDAVLIARRMCAVDPTPIPRTIPTG